MIAPVIVCVVETGIPAERGADERRGAGELGAGAADRLQRGDPHPHRPHDPPAPRERPEADGRVADEDDPEGNVQRLEVPAEKRSTAMMPIVFWASFMPWPNENAAAETSWTFRKSAIEGLGSRVRKIQAAARKRMKPRTIPRSGERTMKTSVFTRPFGTSEAGPAFASAAPAKPPMRACEEEDGRPHHHVSEVPDDGPDEAGEDQDRIDDGRIRRCPCRSSWRRASRARTLPRN